MAYINGNEILFSPELNIQLGKTEQEKAVDITENGATEIFPGEGYVLSKVTANVNVAASGDSKLAQFVDGTPMEITAKDLEGITTIRGYVFKGANITKIEIPSTITNLPSMVFYECNLDNFYYDGTIVDWCNKITFENQNSAPFCRNPIAYFKNANNEYEALGNELIIPEGATQIPRSCFDTFTTITSLVIPNSCKYTANNAFNQCTNLANINLGNGIEEIGEGTFGYCKALQEITIPNSVWKIGSSVFRDCASLTTVRIGNGLSTMYKAFTNCPNLTDIYIDKAEGSVSGSPWGATNAQIHWNTPLPSKEV